MTTSIKLASEPSFRDTMPEELVDELWHIAPELLANAVRTIAELGAGVYAAIPVIEQQLNVLAGLVHCKPSWAVYEHPEMPDTSLLGYLLPLGVLGFSPAEITEAGDEQAQAIELGRRLTEMRFLSYAGGSLAQTAQTTRMRVGRNDPCACGSDVKFKRCCGR
ncbi:MAG: SEC-C metal-binding domain-containing protein [Solirubrobacteraceae bacterium]